MNDDFNGLLFQNELDPDLKDRFESICRNQKNITPTFLINQIDNHIQKINSALDKNEFLDIKAAKKIAGILLDLINQLDDYPSDQQVLITGAARYFVLEEDNEPDTKSLFGFDDDIKVLNYVLGKLGKPKLEV